MVFPPWFIWVVLGIGLMMILRRRRWDRWDRSRRGRWIEDDGETAHWRDLVDAQQQHIEQLESRVGELEERLDFTERLLAGEAKGRVGPGAEGRG